MLKWIFKNEKYIILTKIWIELLPKGPIDNKSALVQVMVCRRRQAITWTNADAYMRNKEEMT